MTYTEPKTYSIDEINMEEIIGLEPDDDSSSSFSLLEEEQEEELESKISRHGFALNPVTKLIVVGGGMLVLVTILAFIWKGMRSSTYTVKRVSQEEIEEKQEVENAKETELAQLKAEMALSKQKEQMKKIKIQPESQPKVEVKRQPSPPLPPPKRVVKTQIQPKPEPLRVVSPSPTVKSIPEPEPEIDPVTLWKELSVAGSYGGNVANINDNNLSTSIFRKDTTQLVSHQKITDSSPKITRSSHIIPNLKNNATRQSAYQSSVANKDENDISSTPLDKKIDQVKLNQVVKGSLVTPIIWYSDNQEELPPAMINLSEAIVTKSGKELFPIDSILIANVIPYHENGGLIELEVTEIRLRDGEIKSIPSGSIVVNRENGKPLIAELQLEGIEDGGIQIDASTILDAASIVSDFADVQGARYLHLLGRRGSSSRRGTNRNVTSFWYLRENIKVSLRVIQSFSVESEVEPLELDLEAINISSRH